MPRVGFETAIPVFVREKTVHVLGVEATVIGKYAKLFFLPLAPLLGSSLPYWSAGLIAQFLDLSQAVRLLGQVISSSQGLYLNTGQHKALLTIQTEKPFSP
jgi:hypothetical protein